jgi:hypothetical protein
LLLKSDPPTTIHLSSSLYPASTTFGGEGVIWERKTFQHTHTHTHSLDKLISTALPYYTNHERNVPLDCLYRAKSCSEIISIRNELHSYCISCVFKSVQMEEVREVGPPLLTIEKHRLLPFAVCGKLLVLLTLLSRSCDCHINETMLVLFTHCRPLSHVVSLNKCIPL